MATTFLRKTAPKRFTKAPRPKSGLRPDIQGLRAFAVVAVILDHLLGWPSGGFVGVDIFFVLSGFLITGLLLREQERTGRISFAGFYRRRVKRIMPAAVLVLALTVGASLLAFNSARAKETVVDSVWALLFGANWHQAVIGTDYFAAGGPESPVQHYWSLAVEEQFYFVWPWLMLGLFALAARMFKGGDRPRMIAGIAMLVLTAASFAWSVFETSTAPTTAYFSTFSRAWELGVGALLACASTLLPRLPAILRPFLAWVGLAGMVASLFVINAQTAFPGPSAALPVLSTALVVAAGTGTSEHRWLAPLTNRVSGYIGDISYSLYLWHFPVIVIGGSLLGESPLALLVISAVFAAGAIYSYHLVEDPIRKSAWLSGGRRTERFGRTGITPAYKLTALSFLAVVTAAVCVAAMVPAPQPKAAAHTPAPTSRTQDVDKTLPELAALKTRMSKALGAQEWPDKVKPSLDQALASPQAPADIAGCGMGVAVDESACTWGDPRATHTALTVGNSISMTYVEALRSALGTGGGWRLISYGMFGCPFMDSARVLPNAVDGCSQRLESTVEAINRIKPDVVFVSGVASKDLTKAQLTKVHAPTKLVFLPGPPGDEDIHACYTNISHPQDCVGEIATAWGSVEKDLAAELKATFVDTSVWFCYQGVCPSFVDSTVVKMDNRHMTPQYAKLIAPVVRESLKDQGIL